jgi:hypothetical protein
MVEGHGDSERGAVHPRTCSGGDHQLGERDEPRAPGGTTVAAGRAGYTPGRRTDTATLRVTRDWEGVGPERAFDVVVDDVVLGSVVKMASVEVAVVPGPHTLVLRSGRHTSPAREFDASAGEEVAFRARAAFLLWPVYLASLVKHDLAISLRRV